MAANFVLYHARGQRLDHWDPNVFLLALSAGVVALVGVSLLTPGEPPASLASFSARLQTPATGPEEEAPALSAEVAAKEGRQLILVNLFHLQRGAAGVGLLRAYRTDLSGFAMGWLIALSLILAAWLLFDAAW